MPRDVTGAGPLGRTNPEQNPGRSILVVLLKLQQVPSTAMKAKPPSIPEGVPTRTR